ncbi:MAG: methyl-accepting chemotaxis protein [Prevotella sp.]|nr:methyl-accepting chemotaxis protein [Prevotella sp.]
MKSIGKKIVCIVVLLMFVSLLFLGVLSSYLNYTSTMDMVEHDFRETAEVSANRISCELTSYINIAKEMGVISELSDENVSQEEKQVILQSHAERYGLQRCNLVDSVGRGIDGNNYSERDYFQNAMKGLSTVSSPLVSKVTGKLTVIVAAPLYSNGSAQGEPIGCVYVVPNEELLNDIMRTINISDNGAAYMIDKTGATIANIDSSVVTNGENVSELSRNPELSAKGYGDLATIHKSALSGKSGFDKYTLDKSVRLTSYTPISGTDGWALIVWSPAEDFLGGTNRGILITIITVVVFLGIGAAVSVKMGLGIGKSVRLCTERIEALASGDLKSEVPEINRKDEAGRLSAATGRVVESLNGMIGDIGRVLEAMAGGDLSVDTRAGELFYVGDYENLLQYLRDINKNLSNTMAQIGESANQVTSGAEQVASGAQALSQGATEQASEIEALASRISGITADIEENSESCENASKLAGETIGYMNTAVSEMTRLSEAMASISETSESISDIINTIEDISFQTNILALNAAVEASRAGEAGKGFAVVADEVRNLASKSAEAAKTTTTLIQQSLDAVHNGTRIASSTSDALAGVEKRASGVDGIVKEIAAASEKQAAMIEQINSGIEQISSVVQTNSATAEQSAAASEELSGQASVLRDLIGTFKIDDSANLM